MTIGAEYWVLRVLEPGRVKVLTQAMISELECVAGELCEPIASYRSETEARARAIAEHRRTGQTHKVTMVI